MAIAFVQEFPIVDGDTSTPNYDAVAERVGRAVPDGLIAHTAGFDLDRGVFRIFDIWDSREAGQRFIDETLMPIVEPMAAQAGEGNFPQPSAEYWYELHDVLS
jgi:hypothetical protein